MKKFVKLSAVFAALVLALSCFVACSNGDDDSDSASVQALQGLWIDNYKYESEGNGDGIYVVDNILYEALFEKTSETSYYNKEDVSKISVSGNKLRMYYDDEYDECEFEINGDKVTITHYDEKSGLETNIYKKIAKTPIGISSDEFNKLGNKLFSNPEE